MRKLAVALASVASLCAATGVVRAEEKTLTGKISDRDCVIACLNYSTESSPKLVFVGQDKKVYQIANQKFAGLIRRAGDLVAVTGDLNGTTLPLTKLEVVPSTSK